MLVRQLTSGSKYLSIVSAHMQCCTITWKQLEKPLLDQNCPIPDRPLPDFYFNLLHHGTGRPSWQIWGSADIYLTCPFIKPSLSSAAATAINSNRSQYVEIHTQAPKCTRIAELLRSKKTKVCVIELWMLFAPLGMQKQKPLPKKQQANPGVQTHQRHVDKECKSAPALSDVPFRLFTRLVLALHLFPSCLNPQNDVAPKPNVCFHQDSEWALLV